MSRCNVSGCDRPLVGRGMCRMHYLREYRAGTVTSAPLRSHAVFECPPDHPHDLASCWQGHGCRCAGCRHLRKMDRQRRRSRLTAYGREGDFRPARVPAQPVRDHLATLMESAGLERIADAAQVSRSAVLDVYYGVRGTNRVHRDASERTVRASLAGRIMAVTPDQIASVFVASTGTERRLRALVAMGYTQSDLATRLGMQVGNFSHLILGKRPRVTTATYQAVSALFADLWSSPQSGARANQARAVAKVRRWVGPLGWDDIDDPAEQPNIRGADMAAGIDETAVELAMHGEPVRLTSAERREAVTRLHRERWSDQRIAATLHIADRTVLRIRQELGLEAFDFSDLVMERAA